MPRTTTEQGLGHAHQQRRAAMPAPNGDPCPYCTEPMWPDDDLDADHVIPRAKGGAAGPLRWSHARCNRRAGGFAAREQHGIRSRAW